MLTQVKPTALHAQLTSLSLTCVKWTTKMPASVAAVTPRNTPTDLVLTMYT